MCTQSGSKKIVGTDIIDHRCIVEFHPADNWDGEHGFDWFRPNYKNITGEYLRTNGPTGKLEFVSFSDEYRKLYYERKWVQKDNNKEHSLYFIPWISTLNYSVEEKTYSNTVCIKIKILIHDEGVNRVEICVGSEENVQATIHKNKFVTPPTIKYSQGNSEPTQLLAFAIYEDGEKTFAGQANIIKKDPIQIPIYLVDIKMDMDVNSRGGSIVSGFSSHNDVYENLKKYLCQAQIKPIVNEEQMRQLDLPVNDDSISDNIQQIKDIKKHLNGAAQSIISKIGDDNEYLWLHLGTRRKVIAAKIIEDIFNGNPVNEKFVMDYKLFFSHLAAIPSITDPYPSAGCAAELPIANSALICKSTLDTSVCHELLHCMGLRHIFENHGNIVFKMGSTDNIMDYPIRDDESLNPLKLHTLWKWQWDIIRDEIKKHKWKKKEYLVKYYSKKRRNLKYDAEKRGR